MSTRTFVVQLDEAQARALLPAPLVPAADFPGKVPGKHPVLLLFSQVMPKKAHWMPIMVDMPYREFAVFMPHVQHPKLQGDFLHSLVLYLDSRSAVWIGRHPYRFPKYRARIDSGEGLKYGQFRADVDEERRVSLDYELAGETATGADAELSQLVDWMTLPLINGGDGKFTCARMDWELVDPTAAVRVTGQLVLHENWLADARRASLPATPMPGLAFDTRWYLSMPVDCKKLQP